MRKGKSRSPPKLLNGGLPLILACLPTTCKNTDSQGCEALILPFLIQGQQETIRQRKVVAIPLPAWDSVQAQRWVLS